MVQNTNASAFIRLRPLENTNVGQIVEEHVRYWRKYKDAQEAEELARKAREAEFNRKVNKDTFEIYNGLTPEENAGFLNAQIIDNFEKNKPLYMELAKRAARGDIDARFRLADEKRKIESAVLINKTYSEKIKALEEQKSKGVFNDVLDADVESFKNSILQGKYKLNGDWSLDVYSPALERDFKEGTSGVNSQGIVRLNSSTLFNNDFLNSTFNKKAEFIKNGKAIAENLLDKEDGNKQITENTKREGINLVRGLFSEDNVEARTWYGTASRRGLVNFNTPFNQLDEVQQNQLADTYYEQVVKPNLEEVTVDNTLDDAIKQQRLRNAQLEATKKRQAIRKGKRDEAAEITTISASTNEAGGQITIAEAKDANGNPVAIESADVFNLNGKPITFGVKGKSNTNVTYSDLIRTQNGDVFAIGQKTIKERVPRTNDDGTIQEDSNGNQLFDTVERVVEDFIETDKKVLNNISRLIENDKGKKLQDLNDLDKLLLNKQFQLKEENKKFDPTKF